MDGKQRKEWCKKERDSISEGVLKMMRTGFDLYSAGILYKSPSSGPTGSTPAAVSRSHTSGFAIPLLACFQVDHPQHMMLCAYPLASHPPSSTTLHSAATLPLPLRPLPLSCHDSAFHSRRGIAWCDTVACVSSGGCLQCGFCNVNGGGINALAHFDDPVKLRDKESAGRLVHEYTAAVKALQEAGNDSRLKQTEKRLRKTINVAGMKPHAIQLWDMQHVDYLNVSISPLHVLKATYADVAEATLRKVWENCGSEAAFTSWLHLADSMTVRELARFMTVSGRVKSRGVSGMLLYRARGGPPTVRRGSKVSLAHSRSATRRSQPQQ